MIKYFTAKKNVLLPSLLCFSPPIAALDELPLILQATQTGWGILALILFATAYFLVILEEVIHLRKCKPVILAAGIIWGIVSYLAITQNHPTLPTLAIRSIFLEYAELLLFLLVAITYIDVLTERGVFKALRSVLTNQNLTYRQCFWVTSFLAFFISPLADNLATSLFTAAIVMSIGSDNPKFVALSCISIVVAANAGGAFSPFGDITTLMVWQKNKLLFGDFIKLFVPALLNFMVPASLLHFAIPKGKPQLPKEVIQMKYGANITLLLFLLTLITTVGFHHFLRLPPTIGMMTGLGYLLLYSHYLQQLSKKNPKKVGLCSFNVLNRMQNTDWDTLLFFYGIMLCVGGLGTLGYLELASTFLYEDLGAFLPQPYQATPANIIVGLASALIDNIPVMFAVLTMNPQMPEGQWLLVTLTAGVGGSLLSIGSAAGVALMGQAKGIYTFITHLKWSWTILLGYIVSVASHIWLNFDTFYRFHE